MTTTLDPKKMLSGYIEHSSELDQKLKALEKELKPIQAQVKERDRLAATLEQLENEIVEANARIESLKGDFFEAQWQEDFEQLTAIGDRRENLKAEVESKTSMLEDARKELDSIVIDSEEVARIWAQLDYMVAPDFLAFVHELRLQLLTKTGEQNGAIQALRNQVPSTYVSDDQIHDARAELDSTYLNADQRKEAREREIQREEEFQRKMKRSLRHPVTQREQPREMSEGEVDYVA